MSSPNEPFQTSCVVFAIGNPPLQARRVSGRGTAGSWATQWVSASLLTCFFSFLIYLLQPSSSRTQAIVQAWEWHWNSVGGSWGYLAAPESTRLNSFSTYIKNIVSQVLGYGITVATHTTFIQFLCVQTQYYCPYLQDYMNTSPIRIKAWLSRQAIMIILRYSRNSCTSCTKCSAQRTLNSSSYFTTSPCRVSLNKK